MTIDQIKAAAEAMLPTLPNMKRMIIGLNSKAFDETVANIEETGNPRLYSEYTIIGGQSLKFFVPGIQPTIVLNTSELTWGNEEEIQYITFE